MDQRHIGFADKCSTWYGILFDIYQKKWLKMSTIEDTMQIISWKNSIWLNITQDIGTKTLENTVFSLFCIQILRCVSNMELFCEIIMNCALYCHDCERIFLSVSNKAPYRVEYLSSNHDSFRSLDLFLFSH